MGIYIYVYYTHMHIYIYVRISLSLSLSLYIYIYTYLQAAASAADLLGSDLQHPALAAGGMSSPGLLGGSSSGSLKSPVGRNCGLYKKIIDQIRSILPWLLEA